ETTQIQSLLFGGLGFKPEGIFLAISLPDGEAKSRRWLAELLPRVAFNDGRYLRQPAVLTLGTSARGLARLGVPKEGVDTFPAAFVSGMQGPGRDRILGDTGENAPGNWWWGTDPIDVVLLVYGDDGPAVDALREEVIACCRRHDAGIVHEVK